MNTTFEQPGTLAWARPSDWSARMRQMLRRIFGCWHPRLSLPFTRGRETYRTCVRCGARRRFDPDMWTMVGPYYYPERNPGSDYSQRR